jgi:hypothetical protein
MAQNNRAGDDLQQRMRRPNGLGSRAAFVYLILAGVALFQGLTLFAAAPTVAGATLVLSPAGDRAFAPVRSKARPLPPQNGFEANVADARELELSCACRETAREFARQAGGGNEAARARACRMRKDVGACAAPPLGDCAWTCR